MNNIWAISKRELKVYFSSPIAYSILFIFLVIAGYFFYSNVAYYALLSFQTVRNPMAGQLNLAEMVLAPMFGNMSVVILLMLPILTMRLLAEEKKSGTFELLFTYPIKDVEVLLGKYFAAMSVFVLMIGATFGYHLILAWFGVSEWGVVFSGYVGILLAGAAFIALGLFVSSLTENQIVAAVVSFGMLLIFWVIGWSAMAAGPPYDKYLEHLSLLSHMINFSQGVINTVDVVYYLSFILLFLFLTLRSLESKRWRG